MAMPCSATGAGKASPIAAMYRTVIVLNAATHRFSPALLAGWDLHKQWQRACRGAHADSIRHSVDLRSAGTEWSDMLLWQCFLLQRPLLCKQSSLCTCVAGYAARMWWHVVRGQLVQNRRFPTAGCISAMHRQVAACFHALTRPNTLYMLLHQQGQQGLADAAGMQPTSSRTLCCIIACARGSYTCAADQQPC